MSSLDVMKKYLNGEGIRQMRGGWKQRTGSLESEHEDNREETPCLRGWLALQGKLHENLTSQLWF